MYATTSLVTVVNLQLTALQTGTMEQAYSYTSKEFQKTISISDFTRYINQFPALKNNDHAIFNERKILNNSGYLGGTLIAKDDKNLNSIPTIKKKTANGKY